MKTYTVKKGNHNFSPIILGLYTFAKPDKNAAPHDMRAVHTMSFSAVLQSSCAVDVVPNSNDDPWNKLCGVAWNLLNPRKNSVMVGWRWAEELKMFELCAYWHDKTGKNHYTKPLYLVAPGELFYADIIVDTNTGSIHLAFERARFEPKVPHDYKVVYVIEDPATVPTIKCAARVINPWFGGSYPAPAEMKISLGRSSQIRHSPFPISDLIERSAKYYSK